MLWFQDYLTILNPENKATYPYAFMIPSDQYSEKNLLKRLYEEPKLKSFVDSFLKTSMKDIQSTFVHDFAKILPKTSPAIITNDGIVESKVDKDTEKEHLLRLRFYRKNKTTHVNYVGFDLHEESDGTQRLILMLPVIYDAITQGKVFIIDEIERSLHPLLSRLFLQTFLNAEPCRGQIIFTTHETTLMDLDLLRRDEIWFAEKDIEESSQIYSLVEFRVRTDLRIDKGYLQGRFGAIPFLGDAGRLGIETKT
jgi:uncharacterized protein